MKKKATEPIDKTDDLDGGKDADYETQHVKAFYDPKTKTAIASTDSVDRMGEVIDQSGWDLNNFKSNPVLLWAHDDRTPRIGTAKNIRVEKSNGKPALMFEPKFNDATELSRAIKQIFEEDGGTFSVGFMPMEMDGNTYTKAELLEISAVNVPANPDARVLSYRSLINKGISSDVAREVTHIKGAVADELAAEQAWEMKCDNMEDVFEIFYAFCDVYYDPATSVNDFTDLLNECVSLLQQVAAGTYSDPDDDEEMPDEVYAGKIFKKVLDKRTNRSKDKRNEAKEPSSAPKRNKHHEEALRMAKILAKAADILNKNEKLPDDRRKSVTKVIKRASDIMIEQHKGDLQ
jgi:HK97 family phage prohead protease